LNLARPLRHLYVQVLIALALGIFVGYSWPDFGVALKPFGDGFVRLVKMMIAPVVFCTIVSGMASLGGGRGIGRILLKAIGLFYAMTFLAMIVGFAAVFLLHPGSGLHINPKQLDATVAAGFSKQIPPTGFADFVLHIIPSSFFGAFSEGEVLPVLLVSALCGYGLTKIGAAAQPVLDVVASFSKMLFTIFGVIMRLAPLGAFGAIAFAIGKYGIKSIGSLGLLVATFYVASACFVIFVLGGLSRWHGFSLWKLLRYIREELLIVLATSSIEPVLPRLLIKLERIGCNKGIVGLVLPTGYSFNLTGQAIYLTLAAMFIAQACDIMLSWGQIGAMLGLMLLTSKGSAGVAGGGLIALVATLSVMPDLPIAGVALIVGIDRFMSEARSLTSLMSNAVSSVVISIWEGACDTKVLSYELTRGYIATEEALEANNPPTWVASTTSTTPAVPAN
jgi:aerobic C4-dicarboxylate transport protein